MTNSEKNAKNQVQIEANWDKRNQSERAKTMPHVINNGVALETMSVIFNATFKSFVFFTSKLSHKVFKKYQIC